MARGIYIHIPFCHQICNYCDFNKVFFKNQPVDQYLEALNKEINSAVNQNPSAYSNVESIFIGGGTPTSLSPKQIDRLLEIIKLNFHSNNIIEFTTETNPDELTKDKMQVLYDYGVNRLSMGVQSFNPDILKKLGRTHSNHHVFDAIEMAKKIGFQDISIDLMYGLPNQTIQDWTNSLKTALSLNLPHYSAYSLIVEPKTIFYIQYQKGKLTLPSEETETAMYDLLMNEMEKHGKHQYEISNFAEHTHESTHNQIYWDNDEYAGFGAGAHGYINGVRYSNIGPIKKYIEAVDKGECPIAYEHEVTLKEKIEEQMFLGLRKVNGVTHAQFESKFNLKMTDLYTNVIQQLKEDSLIEIDETGIRLTRKGRFLGNVVFQHFLMDEMVSFG